MCFTIRQTNFWKIMQISCFAKSQTSFTLSQTLLSLVSVSLTWNAGLNGICVSAMTCTLPSSSPRHRLYLFCVNCSRVLKDLDGDFVEDLGTEILLRTSHTLQQHKALTRTSPLDFGMRVQLMIEGAKSRALNTSKMYLREDGVSFSSRAPRLLDMLDWSSKNSMLNKHSRILLILNRKL